MPRRFPRPPEIDRPPRHYSFYEVRSESFDERCGHTHRSIDSAVKCAPKAIRSWPKIDGEPQKAFIWSCGGSIVRNLTAQERR